MPPGSIWTPSDGGDLDNLLDGVGQTDSDTQDFLTALASLRSPELTIELAALEQEYGIAPDDTVADSVRRARLLAVKTASPGNGTAETMQKNLRAAGFNVYVHENTPPIDPALFLDLSPAAIFGNQQAVFGNASAVFGGKLGELVVNGPTYEHLNFSGAVFGGLKAFFGNENAVFASGSAFAQDLIGYSLPADPGYWPLVFFVGGLAVRNGAGELTEIAEADISLSRKTELISSIVRYKPVHAWAGTIIKYV